MFSLNVMCDKTFIKPETKLKSVYFMIKHLCKSKSLLLNFL